MPLACSIRTLLDRASCNCPDSVRHRVGAAVLEAERGGVGEDLGHLESGSGGHGARRWRRHEHVERAQQLVAAAQGDGEGGHDVVPERPSVKPGRRAAAWATRMETGGTGLPEP